MADPFRPVTRKDVAEKAGVTETIVSYVINNNRYVASEKRERVFAAIKELNYRPNSIARALKGKKSNQILFIADDITNEHFGILVKHMDEAAYRKGYIISLVSYRKDDDFVPAIIQRHIDGIIISSTKVTGEVITQFCDADIPVIILQNREFPDLDKRAVTIFTGLYDGIVEAVDRFVENGRRSLLYIDKIRDDGRRSDMTDLRFKGFCDAMTANGLNFDDNDVLSGCKSEEELYNGIRDKVLSGMSIDGIICRNDRIAAVALRAVLSVGLRIPDDVAVTGFDNSVISRVVTPNLSTLEINRHEIGNKIVEILDRMINHDTENLTHREKFASTYIKRESTGF